MLGQNLLLIYVDEINFFLSFSVLVSSLPLSSIWIIEMFIKKKIFKRSRYSILRSFSWLSE